MDVTQYKICRRYLLRDMRLVTSFNISYGEFGGEQQERLRIASDDEREGVCACSEEGEQERERERERERAKQSSEQKGPSRGYLSRDCHAI